MADGIRVTGKGLLYFEVKIASANTLGQHVQSFVFLRMALVIAYRRIASSQPWFRTEGVDGGEVMLYTAQSLAYERSEETHVVAAQPTSNLEARLSHIS